MKSYTDLEQSKKLSEILPAESADMVYIKHSSSDNPVWEFNEDFPPMILGNIPISEMTVEVLPCWSLTALLDVLPLEVSFNKQTDGVDTYYYIASCDARYCDVYSHRHINIVDACYETIVKLKELNLL